MKIYDLTLHSFSGEPAIIYGHKIGNENIQEIWYKDGMVEKVKIEDKYGIYIKNYKDGKLYETINMSKESSVSRFEGVY